MSLDLLIKDHQSLGLIFIVNRAQEICVVSYDNCVSTVIREYEL